MVYVLEVNLIYIRYLKFSINKLEILDKEETHHHEIADRMTLLENYAQNIETEKNQIREDHLKIFGRALSCG
jgi:hypothetical protein